MIEGSLSLSELLGRVGKALKNEFPGAYWIMAEILEIHVNARGHCYLELIEKNPEDDTLLARARATIWASKYNLLRPYFETTTGMPMKSGIKMLCKGTVEFHAQFGFSINITDIDPAYTLGDLARKRQEVINRLREKGVMEMNRELPFPSVPQHIAVISSETAAGYGDFMESVHHNSHGFYLHTQLFPAVMQGDEAPASIISALNAVYRSAGEYDCVVIIRGGGSRADLECYNNYDLAYYITQFPLPVITGIGHERDESVADMVAAFGLKTPTAVAEFLVDQLLAFEFRLSAYRDSLASSVGRAVQHQRAVLQGLAAGLSHLSRGYLGKKSYVLQQSALLVRRGIENMLVRKRDQLSLLETRNSLVNPANILKRGYSMTLHRGKVISGIEGIGPEDLIETRLYRGRVISKVEETTVNHGKGED
jgi:exodeoxyribonuclease VII large subunit